MRVSVTEAKRNFSHVLKCALVGATVVIMKRDQPVAKLVGLRHKSGARRRFRFGSAKGEFTMPDDFNDPLPKEIEDLFYK